MPNLATKEGVPTGGVFGFASLAIELIKKIKPDYVAVAWDKPKTNIRKRREIYPEYKAGRKPAPVDFRQLRRDPLFDEFGFIQSCLTSIQVPASTASRADQTALG